MLERKTMSFMEYGKERGSHFLQRGGIIR
jgi:hypothetical protein